MSFTLKSLSVPTKTTTVEYPGLPGFTVNVNYLSREVLQSIRKKATKTTFKNREAVQEIDDKLFLDLYVKAAVSGWSGLTVEMVSQLMPLEYDPAVIDPSTEVPYSPEEALTLVEKSGTFDSFVNEQISDLTLFTKKV
jgi:hypothetical protein